MNCEGCKYWEQEINDGIKSHLGQCRRCAPLPIEWKADIDLYEPCWCTTKSDDWCGEFALKVTDEVVDELFRQ